MKTAPIEAPLILLVEDTEDDAYLTMRALRSDGAVEVVVTRSGLEALDFLFCRGRFADRDPRRLPHLVLLDINMPKLNGIEVLRRLRADDRTQLLPVVMLSSSLQERDVADSYAGGANSYLQKPVETNAFREMVEQVRAYWLRVNVPPNPYLSLGA